MTDKDRKVGHGSAPPKKSRGTLPKTQRVKKGTGGTRTTGSQATRAIK